MKRNLSLCMLLLMVPGFLLAQSKFNYYINTGLAKPMAPETFKESYRTGIHLNLGAGKMMQSNLEGLLDISFNQLTFDNNSFASTLEKENTDSLVISGGPCGLLNLTVGLKYLFPAAKESKSVSYCVLRGGLQHRRTQKIDVYDPYAVTNTLDVKAEQLTHAMIGLSLGGEFLVETTTLFAEIGVDVGFEEETQTALILRFGLKI